MTSDPPPQAEDRNPRHPEPERHPATPAPEDGRPQRAPYSGLDSSRLELIRQRKTGNLSPCRKQLGAEQCRTDQPKGRIGSETRASDRRRLRKN
jgi:hypothetical protein